MKLIKYIAVLACATALFSVTGCTTKDRKQISNNLRGATNDYGGYRSDYYNPNYNGSANAIKNPYGYGTIYKDGVGSGTADYNNYAGKSGDMTGYGTNYSNNGMYKMPYNTTR